MSRNVWLSKLFISLLVVVLLLISVKTLIKLELTRGLVDILIVPTLNKALSTFSIIAESISYMGFCYVILCNIAPPGKSAIYGPLLGNKIINILDDRVEDIIVKLDLGGLRRASLATTATQRKDDSRVFLLRPAGYERKLDT